MRGRQHRACPLHCTAELPLCGQVNSVQELVLIAGGIGMASIASLLCSLRKTFLDAPHELKCIERVAGLN